MAEIDAQGDVCSACGREIDFDSDAVLSVDVWRGLERLKDGSLAGDYTISSYLCSEAHFREWAERPLPALEEWHRKVEGELSSGVSWVLLLSGLVALTLMVVGAVAIIQRVV